MCHEWKHTKKLKNKQTNKQPHACSLYDLITEMSHLYLTSQFHCVSYVNEDMQVMQIHFPS